LSGVVSAQCSSHWPSVLSYNIVVQLRVVKLRVENGELRVTMQRDSVANPQLSILNSQLIKWVYRLLQEFWLPVLRKHARGGERWSRNRCYLLLQADMYFCRNLFP